MPSSPLNPPPDPRPLRERLKLPTGPAEGPSKTQPHEVELLGLSVVVTVFERMTAAERRRALAYLSDRYGEQVTVDLAGTYPARGLSTALRNTEAHRDRGYYGRPGFGPAHATTEELGTPTHE